MKLLELHRGVLIQKLINGEISSTNSNLDSQFLNLDSHSLGPELIDTLGFPHKHNLELGSLGVIVDIFRQLFVNWVILHGNVNSDSLFQIDDVLLEGADLNFGILKLLEELQGDLVGLVDFLLHGDDVVGGLITLHAHLVFLSDELLDVATERLVLGG